MRIFCRPILLKLPSAIFRYNISVKGNVLNSSRIFTSFKWLFSHAKASPIVVMQIVVPMPMLFSAEENR